MSTCSLRGRPWGRFRKAILLVLSFCLLWSSGAYAEMFIRFYPDVRGESITETHFNWSNILALDWGLSLSSGGQINLHDVSWFQYMDTSFPTLFSKCANQAMLDWAEVDFVSNNNTYFSMYFEDVQISSLNTGGSSEENWITFNGTFGYRYIWMEYVWYYPDGRVKERISADYDLAVGGELAALSSIYTLGISGPNAVPIPPSVLLLGSGLLGLAGVGWRRRRKI